MITGSKKRIRRRGMPGCRAIVLGLFPALLLLPSPAYGQTELVLQKGSGKEYHRPGCKLVKDGKGVVAMTRAQAESRGLTSHAACDPATPESAGRDKPAPVLVHVDEGRYYHRESCRKLAAKSRKVPLEEAAKKFWPCPTCKPPIRPRKDPAGGRPSA